MKKETKVVGDCAIKRLIKILADVTAETAELVEQGDIPTIVRHFSDFRDLTRALQEGVEALNNHTNYLSYEIIPTLFTNANVKSINVVGLGAVTINVRWNATMIDKERGLEWLRDTGNDGLIIQTVAAPTLTAFAKSETLSGRPLPDSIFKVGTAQYVSIRKSGVSNHEPAA